MRVSLNSFGDVSNLTTNLLRANARVESSITSSVLTGDAALNPQSNLFKKFQISALLGHAYNLFSWFIELEEQNKKLLKDTHELALAAK